MPAIKQPRKTGPASDGREPHAPSATQSATKTTFRMPMIPRTTRRPPERTIGILNVVLVADCVADGACGSLPSEAGPVFLGCFIAGIVLLAVAFGLSARGLSRRAESR